MRQTQSIPLADYARDLSHSAEWPILRVVLGSFKMPHRITTAVLLAAGRGSRLGDLTAATPKPMLEIAGAPLISHIVDSLADASVTHFIIVTGYMSQKIEDWANIYLRRNPGLKIKTIRQPRLDGTGGAMLTVRDLLTTETRFVFGWGDILIDAENYRRFLDCARAEEYDLMLAINRVEDPYRGAAVYLSDADSTRVERLVEKPPRGTSQTNWNNAGLFAADSTVFDYLGRLAPSPRGELELPDAIAHMIDDGRVVRAIDIRGFWSDIGTPRDLELARRQFNPATAPRQSNIPRKSNIRQKIR